MSDRVHWLERPSALASKALLYLLDTGLEHSHVLLQLCEGALEDLTPAALVGESRLDPARSPRTRARALTDSRLPRILKAGYKFLTFVLSMEELHMSLVKVKEKFQVTLPAAIRQKVGVDVGDLLEATVQGKRITFTPKVAVDRAFVEQRLAEGLEDVKKGRVYGPFSSAKALVRSLHHESRKLKKR